MNLILSHYYIWLILLHLYSWSISYSLPNNKPLQKWLKTTIIPGLYRSWLIWAVPGQAQNVLWSLPIGVLWFSLCDLSYSHKQIPVGKASKINTMAINCRAYGCMFVETTLTKTNHLANQISYRASQEYKRKWSDRGGAYHAWLHGRGSHGHVMGV